MTRIHSHLSIRPCATAPEEPTCAHFVPRAWLLLFAVQFNSLNPPGVLDPGSAKHKRDAPGRAQPSFRNVKNFLTQFMDIHCLVYSWDLNAVFLVASSSVL